MHVIIISVLGLAGASMRLSLICELPRDVVVIVVVAVVVVVVVVAVAVVAGVGSGRPTERRWAHGEFAT